ncbi:SUMF1/EgtB/PvdO family nonheme iron enzyme [Chelatococcus sp. SYSU_G07232]|uniref:SUMF1/EgtB/PvdO family nonheme iron enzyme n=1 Tax=Chelatococcus albus TaxID=3047466 RepID=A0ABT7AFX1_9HYPH|nr:SUMF1/EgtB/PvdO family nonheme iron enzyme [Chelatococcus sp. SYSU_G07232]MDJ1157526.1 SUMF1/EgtB/PvdO family nonheme iron enzyme [Chelatococcus sp. SYSU_G07232]
MPSYAVTVTVAAAGAAAMLFTAIAAARPPDIPPAPDLLVSLPPGTFQYRVAGDFNREGRPVNAPLRTVRIEAGLSIMKTEVSAADYDRCVAAGACAPRADGEPGRADLPVVGVSWQDATAYAAWFSARTGERWRLPTDAEWAYAAGSHFKDDAIARDDGAGAVSERWLARYDQEWEQQGFDRRVRPHGAFGANERGIIDLTGNVWEWTNTCFLRQGLDATGEAAGPRTVNCGVRVVAGEHRSYVTDFIRDVRAGGCSVGVPPANLGFRLVREEGGFLAGLATRLRRILGRNA